MSTGTTAKSTASLFGSTTSSASTGFSGFGNTGGGLKLGGTATAASTTVSSGFSFGSTGGGISSTSAFAPSLNATTTNSQFQGLGGTSITTNASSQGNDGAKNSGSNQALKDENIPPELAKDVNEFEKFMKNQKESNDVVGKFSVHSLRKIQEEITTLCYALGSVSSALHRNTAAVQKLKSDFSKELKNTEMARHTKDIPPSMQHDNIAPIRFFMDMVVEFEGSMQVYRKQIEELENHLNLTEQTSSLTAQDIYLALCKMQESFISLAANLHSTHDQVKQLKENYLIYRRIVHNDPTDVFAENRKKATKETVAKSSGISPLTQLNNFVALAMATMANQPAQQQGPPQQGFLSTQTTGSTGLFGATKPTGGGSLFGNTAATTSSSAFGGFNAFGASSTKPLSAGFGSTATAGTFGGTSFNSSAGLTFGATPSFELKRPPLGNKRGKK